MVGTLAARRPYQGYGSSKPQMAGGQRIPMPPPPDGQVPVRLPIGAQPVPDEMVQDEDPVMALLRKLGQQ